MRHLVTVVPGACPIDASERWHDIPIGVGCRHARHWLCQRKGRTAMSLDRSPSPLNNTQSRRVLARRAAGGLLAVAGAATAGRDLLGAPGALYAAPAQASTDDIAIGSPNVDYVDPEFHSGTNRITFRDAWPANGNVWVSTLDPTSGTFVSGTGQDVLIDGQIAHADESADNGPEWIKDAGIDKILYTRTDGAVERMFMRDLVGGAPEALGPADGASRTHCAGTTAPSGRAKLLYRRWVPSLSAWKFFWLDLGSPVREFTLPEAEVKISLPTWVDARYILLSQVVAGVRQLALYDTVSQSVTVQTTDADDKFGAYAWRAPELGGRILYMAAIRFAGQSDVTAIRIYWRERSTDTTLTPFATLRFPTGTTPGGVRSPEPFTFQGHSYISLALEPADKLDTSIWVFSVPPTKDGAPFRPPQRVDDSTLRVNKIDPEPYATDSRVFVYYYYVEPETFRTHLRRCAVTPRS
jgi:hypothetical protein